MSSQGTSLQAPATSNTVSLCGRIHRGAYQNRPQQSASTASLLHCDGQTSFLFTNIYFLSCLPLTYVVEYGDSVSEFMEVYGDFIVGLNMPHVAPQDHGPKTASKAVCAGLGRTGCSYPL